VATLNNLIVTKIKLKHFDEAQRLCRDALDELKNSLSSQHPSSLCIQCSLSACLFLSSHIDEAEELFNDLRHLTDSVAFEPVKGFFEVLVLVRLTHSDYLVLRDSKDGVQGLVPVEDYATQSQCGVQHPTNAGLKKTRTLVNYFESVTHGEVKGMVANKLCRGDFRSLRRMCSLNAQVAKQTKAKNRLSDGSTQVGKTYGPLQARSGIANASEIPQPAVAASFDHNSRAPLAMTSVNAGLPHTEALDPSRRLTNGTNGSGYTATTDRSSVSKTF
jgi:hypothetical protein